MDKQTLNKRVYIRDKTHSWLPANLISIENDVATVHVEVPENWHENTYFSDALQEGERTVNLCDYPGKILPSQNVDCNGKIHGKSDMTDLEHLHEAAILYNVKDQHVNSIPYTKVGDIILATNPFHRFVI